MRKAVAAGDNPAVIARAIYDVGGAGRFVDIEEVFLRAYEIAPERFGWRTRPIPNYKTLYKALRDFEAANSEAVLKTEDGLGRQLTAAGVVLAERQLAPSEDDRIRAQRSVQRLLSVITSSPFFREFIAGGEPSISRFQIAELLVVAPDAEPASWIERITAYEAAATVASRTDILQFLAYLRQIEPERLVEKRHK